MIRPLFQIEARDGLPTVVLAGDWTLAGIAGDEHRPDLRPDGRERRDHRDFHHLQKRLADAAGGHIAWDLSAVSRLDSAGALLLWQVWGNRRPPQLLVDQETERAIRRVESAPGLPERDSEWHLAPLLVVGRRWLNAWDILLGMVALVGQVLLDTWHVVVHPRDFPGRELSAALHKSAVTALPITGLLGFLIGIVLSYLMALQLKGFGVDTLIINVLGYGILRELGPVLMAVVVAGRSGSAMTAQLGLMRVTEEIDALATMGISRTLRLVLPKVAALTLAGPLLMLWTSAMALVGGMLAAWWQLDIDPGHFVHTLPAVVPFGTLLIGLLKGAIFCGLIGVIACYFGLNVRPNTESLSVNTTLSVVVGITVVIVADALLAVMVRDIGVPFR